MEKSSKKQVKRGSRGMLIPTIIMGLLAIVILYLAYNKGGGEHIMGLKAAGIMLLQLIPLLVFAFIMAGTVPLLIPQEVIAGWIGGESGMRGILIGTLAGGLMPGGPYVSLPLAMGFLRVGAGIGTMVAFITGWSLLAFSRLPMEIGIMGWKFTSIRLVCTFFFPPIAGFIASKLFANIDVV